MVKFDFENISGNSFQITKRKSRKFYKQRKQQKKRVQAESEKLIKLKKE